MKKAKKILTLVVVAMIMVMAMSVTAFAAGTNTITVKDGYAGQTYTLYKIFDATTTESRRAETDADENTSVTAPGISYTLPDGKSLDTVYTYTDSASTVHSVKGTDWFTVDSTGNITANDGADVSTAAFREWAKQFGTKIDSKTVGDANADVVFSNLGDGYYFVTTTTGSLITVNSVAPNAIIKDKNEVPSIEKVVSGGTETGSAIEAVKKEENTASVGDVLTFDATVHAKPNATKYIFEDTLADGLTLVNYTDADTAATPAVTQVQLIVTVGGAELDKGTDYTLDTFDATASPEIKITFTQSYLDKITENTDIVITYKAMVNQNAVIAGNGNDNTATLKYGDNETSVQDSTKTFVYQFGLYKTTTINDVEHTVLTGAKFKLYDAETGGNEIPLVKSGEVYRPALKDETAVEIEVGTATISGLSNGTYYLEETEAPDGYNKLTERQSITITDSNNEGTVADNIYQPESGGLEVVNQSGVALPETGGMGTTIFYIAGAVLVLGAVVILITRRRVSK